MNGVLRNKGETPLTTDQILVTLTTHGPLPLWRLRELLHVGERPLYSRLSHLRDRGVVKRIGHNDRRVFWAISTYDGPRPTWSTLPDDRRPTPHRLRRSRAIPTAAEPSRSWWLTADFAAAARFRAHDMGWGTSREMAELASRDSNPDCRLQRAPSCR